MRVGGREPAPDLPSALSFGSCSPARSEWGTFQRSGTGE